MSGIAAISRSKIEMTVEGESLTLYKKDQVWKIVGHDTLAKAFYT